jgi:predicted ribonuclease YlaK
MTYYVVDTNVIIDYTDIIPNGKPLTLDTPSVDLAGHCLVIPVAVIKELDKFKNEQGDRGHAAREALKRLDAITQRMNVNIKNVNTLKSPIMVENGGYSIQVLPVDYRFCGAVSFRPASDDMDGQIILATLAALCTANNQPVDGSPVSFDKLNKKSVVLLTNDRGMAIRARTQGIDAMQFRYSVPAPYTGRRDLAVPDKLFLKFFSEGRLSNEEWQQALPNEEPLVANEFLIMRPESGVYPEGFVRGKYWHVGRFDAASREIQRLKHWLRSPVEPRNEGQVTLAEALVDPNITCVICTGPAGTGKTYMTTVFGLDACRKHRFDGVVVVPCDPENSSKLGALPGDLDAKMDPSVRPHKNALENYTMREKKRFAAACANNPSVTTTVPVGDEESDSALASLVDEQAPADISQTDDKGEATTKRPKVRATKKRNKDSSNKEKKPLLEQVEDEVETLWKAWFRNIPVYHARGLSFPGKLVLYDEFQDQSRRQAYNLLTRKGEGSMMVITGDVEQIHSAYLDRENNGLVYARQVFKGHPLVAQITFTSGEIVRDPLVQYLVEQDGKM